MSYRYRAAVAGPQPGLSGYVLEQEALQHIIRFGPEVPVTAGFGAVLPGFRTENFRQREDGLVVCDLFSEQISIGDMAGVGVDKIYLVPAAIYSGITFAPMTGYRIVRDFRLQKFGLVTHPDSAWLEPLELIAEENP